MKNKSLLIIILVLIYPKLYSEDTQLPPEFFQKGENDISCINLFNNAVEILTDYLEENKSDSIVLIIDYLNEECQSFEWTKRVSIINAIMSDGDSEEYIETYFKSGYHFAFLTRMVTSSNDYYDINYRNNIEYFEYLPLRHPLDSLTSKISGKLLERNDLSEDEKLVCILFYRGFDAFESAVFDNNKKDADNFVRRYHKHYKREYYNSIPAWQIYMGIYSSIGPHNILNQSPLIGFSFSTPIESDVVLELALKIRYNLTSRRFDYYAINRTHSVKSRVAMFFGGLIGIKALETENLILMPKVGVGLEYIDTGITEERSEHETKYHDLKAMHLSIGVSVLKPVVTRKYLGLQLSLHFVPYNSVHQLRTTFDNLAVSGQLFFRF